MLVTLLLTQYLMPVLYTFFPGKATLAGGPGHVAIAELSEGSHYTDEVLQEEPGPDLNPEGEGL
jgi:cobalt-zinc-cadmium resistance protein CzcA